MATDANLDRDDPFGESDDSPTPNGGVGSVIRYQDADGQPARRSKAVKAEIGELDDKGNVVFRTYMEINRKG